MSETATSLQDARQRRESCEPALPLDWISAVTRRGRGRGVVQVQICTTLTSHSLFISMIQFVSACCNQQVLSSGSRRIQTAGLNLQPHCRCQTTCTFFSSGTALFQSSSLTLNPSFWLLWTEPKLPEFLPRGERPVFTGGTSTLGAKSLSTSGANPC